MVVNYLTAVYEDVYDLEYHELCPTLPIWNQQIPTSQVHVFSRTVYGLLFVVSSIVFFVLFTIVLKQRLLPQLIWLYSVLFQYCTQDGVILGADTRATEGPIVCDKNCEKIHYMAPNIYCCGAGTAADTEAVTGICWGEV